MALTTLSEIRTHVMSTVRETQNSSLFDSFINLTLSEMWNYHTWTFKRRKTTFSTVASQEDYSLDEEVDEIALIRQISVPTKIVYVPDDIFYALEPAPENQSTGNPRYYRKWEETGFKAQLSADGTIYVSSSSSSDGSSFNVIIRGRNSSGEVVSESITLNGTSSVTSSTTWDDGGLLQISKSAATTGTITCYATTGNTVLAELAPEDLAPRYKKISLYPVPSSVVTIYMEYWERLMLLVNSADVPQIDKKWIWVLREGSLAKAWEYKQSEAAAALHYAAYQNGLKIMKEQDDRNMDYVPVIRPRVVYPSNNVRRVSDSVSSNFPSYAVTL